MQIEVASNRAWRIGPFEPLIHGSSAPIPNETGPVGRLGCPLDYWVFTKGLMPLLQRFHGATRHVGKVAQRREGAMERLRMRTRLREAIAGEQYEEAARLRDLLRQKDPHA